MRRVARACWRVDAAWSPGSTHAGFRRALSTEGEVTERLAAAAAGAVSSPDFGPVSAALSLLEAVHTTTGLPWWLSIAASTVCVRAALVPLSVLQAQAGSGLSSVLATARAKGVAGDVRAVAALLRAQRQSSGGGGMPHPGWLLVAPIVQLPVFITAMLAVRRAALLPCEGMSTGGAAWFMDLTQPALDWGALTAPAGPWGAILPATAVGLMMLNIQQAFGPPDRRTQMMGHYKLFLEWLTVPTLAAGLALPQAVFCYWIPSNAWTLAQGTVLRQRYALLPPPPSSPDARALSATLAEPASAMPGHIDDTQQALDPDGDASLTSKLASLLSQAATARASGRLEESAALLAQALAAAPAHPRVEFAAGQLASVQARWQAAAEHYAKAAAFESDILQRGRAHFGHGVALAMLARADGRTDCPEAEQAFTRAAADRPGDGRPHLALASLLRAAGKEEQARVAAAIAAALDPRAKGGAGAGGSAT